MTSHDVPRKGSRRLPQDALRVSAEAIHVGSEKPKTQPAAVDKVKKAALTSVARVKLLAIAKRKQPTATDKDRLRRPNALQAIDGTPQQVGRSNVGAEKQSATPETKERSKHRVGTVETDDGTWKASIHGDIDMFMYPSLRLETAYNPDGQAVNKDQDARHGTISRSSSIRSTARHSREPALPPAELVDKIMAADTMTVEWEMQPRSDGGANAQAAARIDTKRAEFEKKLEAAEAMLVAKESDQLGDLGLTGGTNAALRGAGLGRDRVSMLRETRLASLYHPDVVSSQQLIPRLPQTRKIIKEIQRHSTKQGQIQFYADKQNLFAKWKQLHQSEQHRLPERRYDPTATPPGSDEEDEDEMDDPADQLLGELSPRSLFYHECVQRQILPEPIFSRINDVKVDSTAVLASTSAVPISFPSVAATLVRAIRNRQHDDLVAMPSGRIVRKKHHLALHLQQFGLGDAKTIALSKSLEHFQSIHVLDLSDNRLTDAAIIPLLESLERGVSLTKLPDARYITAASATDTRRLHQDHSPPRKLSDVVARVALSGIESPRKTGSELSILNLSQNAIGREGYRQIARFLGVCRVLTHLNLSHTSLDGDDALAPLTTAIENHPTLQIVNLSDNQIGEQGGLLLGDMLTQPTCTLTELDVSWNSICRSGAVAIGVALRTNTNLRTLNIGMNRCGDQGGEQLAASMEINTTLTELDLSRNAIGGASAVSFGFFLRKNRSLRCLQLQDNNLGPVGAKALARAIALGSPCEIHMSVHDFESGSGGGSNCAVTGGATFDAAFPSLSSPFELKLTDSPYAFAVASELLDAAMLYGRCVLSDIAFIDDLSDKRPKRIALVVDAENRCLRDPSASAKQWKLPTYGVFCATAKFTPPDISRLALPFAQGSPEEESAYMGLIRIIRRGMSPRETACLLDLALSDLYLTTSQAAFVFTHLKSLMDPVEIIGRLWPCLTDGENAFAFLQAHLQAADQRRLIDRFGMSTIQFTTANPTGHWSLDMNDARQRKIAVWFTMLNALDAASTTQLHAKRVDPSQYGRNFYWRNVRHNQTKLRLTHDFFDRLPRSGILELDYASPVRHEDVGSPPELTDEELAELLSQIGAEVCSIYVPLHKRTDLKYQLVLLHVAMAGRFVTSSQAHYLLQHYPKNLEGFRFRTVLAVHKGLIDIENFGELLDRLAVSDRPRVYTALGYLNTVNPLAVDMDYEVDFEREDETMLLRALVDLSMAATMDVIRIDSERSTVLVIYSMYQTNAVPSSGRICFRYATHPIPNRLDWLRVRQQIFRYFLCGDRLKALGDGALALSVCAPPNTAGSSVSVARPLSAATGALSAAAASASTASIIGTRSDA